MIPKIYLKQNHKYLPFYGGKCGAARAKKKSILKSRDLQYACVNVKIEFN